MDPALEIEPIRAAVIAGAFPLNPAQVTTLKIAPALAAQPTTVERIRILIADSQAIFAGDLRILLESEADFDVVGQVTDGIDAMRLASALRPHVLLLDAGVRGLAFAEVLRGLNRAKLPVRTILLSATLDRWPLAKGVQAGARGFLLRATPADLLLKSIRKVHRGELWIGREMMAEVVEALADLGSDEAAPAPGPDFGLTPREHEILTLVVNGETNSGVARTLSVGRDTLKHHLTSIFDKTGVSSRLELALFAIHHRLVQRRPE